MTSFKQNITPLELSGWDDDLVGQKQIFTPYFTLSIQNQMNRDRKNGIAIKNRQESNRYKGSLRDNIEHSMAISLFQQEQKPRYLEMKTVALPGVHSRKYRWSQETKQYFKLRMGRQNEHKSPTSTHKNHSILSPLQNTRISSSNKPLSLQLKQSPQIQSDLSNQLIQHLKYRQNSEEKGSCVFQKPFSKAYRCI